MPRHRAHRAGGRKLVYGAVGLSLLCAGSIADINLSSKNASAATPVNLVADPEFKQGAQAWTTAAGGSLGVVAGYDGHSAVSLTNTTSGPLTLALNDKVNTVAKTTAGAVYQASAWIRTDAPGTSAAARLMEYQGSVNHGSALGTAWLKNSDWTHVTATYTATTSASSIDYNLLAWSLPAGKSLLVSEPSLVVLSEPSGSAPVSSATLTTASSVPATSSSASQSPKPSSSSTAAQSSVVIVKPTPSATRPLPPTSTVPPSPSPSPTGPAPVGEHLVWSDEFNSIDTKKWNVRNNSWANNEESIDTSRPENVFISGGALTLRAIQQSYKVGGTTRNYTSGYLDTIGKESWQYGRIEMRAKLPAAQGMWPAFWLRNNTGLGELDIMEAIGGMSDRTVQTIHQSTNGDMARSGHEDVLPSGTISDWHTYAVDREPGSVSWYVDNRLVFSKTTSTLPWLDSTFNSPMNIRLNLQVGGSMPGYYKKPAGATPVGAADYVIDYVRVYQR